MRYTCMLSIKFLDEKRIKNNEVSTNLLNFDIYAKFDLDPDLDLSM